VVLELELELVVVTVDVVVVIDVLVVEGYWSQYADLGFPVATPGPKESPVIVLNPFPIDPFRDGPPIPPVRLPPPIGIFVHLLTVRLWLLSLKSLSTCSKPCSWLWWSRSVL